MRLLTHNILMCNRSDCKNGFPLKILLDRNVQEPTKYVDTRFNSEQIKRILEKLDWTVLVQTASQFGLDLPTRYSEQDKNSEIFLNAVHEAVIKFHIMEAELVCPLCNYKYIISKGIPNMLTSNSNSDEDNSNIRMNYY